MHYDYMHPGLGDVDALTKAKVEKGFANGTISPGAYRAWKDALAKYEAELSSARAAAHAARGELRAEGQRHKDATVTAARAASAEQLNALRETLDADTTRVRADLSGQVEALSKAIVDRILGRAA